MRRSLFLTALAASLLFVAPSPQAHAITKEDVVNMSNIGVADSVIISAIDASGTVFDLSANDIIELTRAGVSQGVIEAMQKTRKKSASPAQPATAPEKAAPTQPAPEKAGPETAPPPRTEPSETRTEKAPATQKPAKAEQAPPRSKVLAPAQVKPLPADVKQLKRRYDTGKYTSAAAAAFDLLTGPNKERYADSQSTIYYYLGKSLYKLNYFHAAHKIFLKVAQEGPAGPHYSSCLSMLTRTSQQLKEFDGFQRVLGGTSTQDLPRRVKSTLLYLIGSARYDSQDFDEARRALEGVSQNSEFYGQAQFLEGMSMYRQGDSRQAVRTFRALIEASLAGDPEDIKDLKDLSLLNMARVYYRVEDYKRAEQLYDLVPRDSRYWPQSLYEAAYTNFWQGDYNVSLGQILTIGSPFFKGKVYIPEVGILEALTYYNLCEYDRVLAVLKGYQDYYKPLRDNIRAFTKKHEAATQVKREELRRDKEAVKQANAAYSALFESGTRKKDAVFPSEIMVSLEENKDFRNYHHHLGVLHREIDEMKNGKGLKGTNLGASLLQDLEADEKELRAEAGRYLLEQLGRIEKELSNLLGQSDIIQFEVVNAQKEEFEDKFRNPEYVETYEKLEHAYATESSLIFWPFTGEFWEDELGYYRFTERGACRSRK